jgi:hypothetical protein
MRFLMIGWEYYIQEPHNRQFKPKAYATNFDYCTALNETDANISTIEIESHHHEIGCTNRNMPLLKCYTPNHRPLRIHPSPANVSSNPAAMTLTRGNTLANACKPLELAKIVINVI